MFSATRLLGGLVSNGFGRTARRALGGGGMMGTAAKVAGVAAVGGAAYAAYRHYQAGGFGRGGPGLFGGGQQGAQGAAAGPGGFGGAPAGQAMGAGPGGFGGAAQGGQASPGWTDAAGAGFGASSNGTPATPAAPQATAPQATAPQAIAPQATAPQAQPPPAQPTSAEEEQALLLVRAMIAAANIDGQIDRAERQRILQGAANAGFGPEEQQALETELANPHAPNVLLGQVRRPDLAEQFYLVTLLATDLDSDHERTYVKALPLILQLPPAKVGEIHQQLGVPPVA